MVCVAGSLRLQLQKAAHLLAEWLAPLLVCHGQSTMSPLAECLLLIILKKEGLSYKVIPHVSEDFSRVCWDEACGGHRCTKGRRCKCPFR